MKKETKRTRVSRAKKAIRKFVSTFELGQPVGSEEKTGEAVRYAIVGGGMKAQLVAVLLPDGRWTWNGDDPCRGYVDGFNLHAIEAAYVCRDLGLITEQEADDFRSWHNRRWKTINDASKLKRLEDDAARAGYRLVKKAS